MTHVAKTSLSRAALLLGASKKPLGRACEVGKNLEFEFFFKLRPSDRKFGATAMGCSCRIGTTSNEPVTSGDLEPEICKVGGTLGCADVSLSVQPLASWSTSI